MSAKPLAPADPRGPFPAAPPFRAALRFSAFRAAFGISLRQMARPNRLLVLFVLFLLPLAVIVPIRFFAGQEGGPPYDASVARTGEEFLLLMLIPSVLVPLTGLLLSSGMIRDEIEGQTLTYLLVRPLWRPALYVTKWKAAWLISFLLTAFAVPFLFAALYVGIAEPSEWLPRCARSIALFALTLLAYTGVFGLLSLISKRGALLGVVYLLAFEQIFANTEFVLRKATVLYHFRALALRWLDLGDAAAHKWSMEMNALPDPRDSVFVLAGIGIAAIVIGAIFFRLGEFRMKGPEGD